MAEFTPFIYSNPDCDVHGPSADAIWSTGVIAVSPTQKNIFLQHSGRQLADLTATIGPSGEVEAVYGPISDVVTALIHVQLSDQSVYTQIIDGELSPIVPVVSPLRLGIPHATIERIVVGLATNIDLAKMYIMNGKQMMVALRSIAALQHQPMTDIINPAKRNNGLVGYCVMMAVA
jgi:hypothetical protein